MTCVASASLLTSALLESSPEALQAWCSEPGNRAQIERALESSGDSFRLAFEVSSHRPLCADQKRAEEWTRRYASAAIPCADVTLGLVMPVLRWLVAVVRQHGEIQSHGVLHAHVPGELRMALLLGRRESVPPETRRALACNYLMALPGGFAFAGLVDEDELALACSELLRAQSYPILRWQRVQALMDMGTDELAVRALFSYCGEDFRSQALPCLRQRSAATLALLQSPEAAAWLSPGGQILAALFACDAEVAISGGIVEEGLKLDLFAGSLVDVDVSARAFARAGSPGLRLVAQFSGELRALALVPHLEDEDLVFGLFRALEEGHHKDVVVDALRLAGERAAEVAVSRIDSQFKAATLRLAIRCVWEHPSPVGCAWLAGMVTQGSVTVRTLAARALTTLGHGAATASWVRTALQEAASVEPALRSLAERIVATPPVSTRGAEVVALAAGHASGERERFLRLCERMKDEAPRWSSELRPEILRLGAVALYWLRPELEQAIVHGHTRLWCFVVETLSRDPAGVWEAVESFAHLPKVRSAFWARPRRALSQAGALLVEPILSVLRRGESEHLEPLFGLLAEHARAEASELFILGLGHQNRTVRARSVDGLSRLTSAPEALRCRIEGLLEAGVPATRCAALELLAIWGRADSLAALQRALERERSPQVRPYLLEALVAVGAVDLVLPAGSSLQQRWALFFAAQPRPKTMPAFLRHVELPEVHWASGIALNQEAQMGLLSWTMRLQGSLKGRLLRSARSVLDSTTLAVWSRILHERWARAKDSKHRWAVLQLWLFAADDSIQTIGAALSRLRAGEHVAAGAYLKVLQWHPSPLATSWLLYWAELLPSRGLRQQARECAERVAFRCGLSWPELRAKADWSLGARASERELKTEPASPLGRYRLVELFERALRTGETFDAAAILELRDAYPEIVRPLVFCTGAGLLRRGADLTAADGSGVRLAHPLLDDMHAVSPLAPDIPVALPQAERSFYIPGSPWDLELSSLDTNSNRYVAWRRREGWLHGEPMDQGIVQVDFLPLPAVGLVAHVEHSGYNIGVQDWSEEVTIATLGFHDLDGAEIDVESVPPVVYSEVCLSLARLRSSEEG